MFATLGANVMGDMVFPAALAGYQVFQTDGVMRPALVTPCFGYFTFWQRSHDLLLTTS